MDTLGRTWLHSDFALWVCLGVCPDRAHGSLWLSFQAPDLDKLLNDPETDIDDTDRIVLKNSNIVQKHIAGRAPKGRVGRAHRPQKSKVWTRQLPTDMYAGNPDLAVALPERLNPTHVTPRIANLAFGLVQEELRIVGARTPTTWKDNWEKSSAARARRVEDLILQAKIHKPRIKWGTQDKVQLGSKFLKKVIVEKTEYFVSPSLLARPFETDFEIARRRCRHASSWASHLGREGQ